MSSREIFGREYLFFGVDGVFGCCSSVISVGKPSEFFNENGGVRMISSDELDSGFDMS